MSSVLFEHFTYMGHIHTDKTLKHTEKKIRKKIDSWTGKMAQQIKALATKV